MKKAIDCLIEYTVEVLPEDCPIKGNLIVSGDDETDREAEQEVMRQLDSGNEWAWCIVRVTAKLRGIDDVAGTDYLGGCSYNSQADFEACGELREMKEQAKDDLIKQLKKIKEIVENVID